MQTQHFSSLLQSPSKRTRLLCAECNPDSTSRGLSGGSFWGCWTVPVAPGSEQGWEHL